MSHTTAASAPASYARLPPSQAARSARAPPSQREAYAAALERERAPVDIDWREQQRLKRLSTPGDLAATNSRRVAEAAKRLDVPVPQVFGVKPRTARPEATVHELIFGSAAPTKAAPPPLPPPPRPAQTWETTHKSAFPKHALSGGGGRAAAIKYYNTKEASAPTPPTAAGGSPPRVVTFGADKVLAAPQPKASPTRVSFDDDGAEQSPGSVSSSPITSPPPDLPPSPPARLRQKRGNKQQAMAARPPPPPVTKPKTKKSGRAASDTSVARQTSR